MVRRREGIRHEHAGHGERRDLCHGGRACTREHEVRGRKGLAHAVDVGHDAPARGLVLREGELLHHGVVFPLARGVDDAEVLAREELGLQGRDPLVEVTRAEAAAEDEQHRGVLWDAEATTALRAVGADDALPDGVARDDDLGVGPDLAPERVDRDGKRHAYRLHLRGGRLVGKPRHGVLLVDDAGDALRVAPVDEGELDVGAKAHRDVRARRAEVAADGLLGGTHAPQRRDERPGTRAVEARDVDGVEREARLRDERGLQLLGLAEELHLVPARGELLCQRERRVDVARGSAGGDRHPQAICHACPSFCPGSGRRSPSPRDPGSWSSGGRSRSAQGRCASCPACRK